MKESMLLIPILFLVISCDPGIGSDETITPIISTFDDKSGLIILPNDLLKDPLTGRLNLPILPSDSDLTKEIKGFINMLDGWMVAQTINIPFEYELDKSTIKPETVLLFDIDVVNKSVMQKTAAEYYVLYNFSMTPQKTSPYYITVKNKPTSTSGGMPADFIQGHYYLVAVTEGVKTLGGKDISENPAYYFMKKRDPLIDERGRSLTILSDSDAARLEPARKLFNQFFTMVEAQMPDIRDKTIAFSFFSIQSGPRALFNPTSIGQILPQPNDLRGPSESPLDVKPYIYYDLPLDEKTLSDGVIMLKLTEAQPAPIEISKVEVSQENDRYKLVITPKDSLENGSRYLVLTTSNIKGRNGVESSAYSTFSILRARNPFVTKVDDVNYVLNSPLLDNTLDVLIIASRLGMLSDSANKNIAAATADDWKVAYGLLVQNLVQLEQLRNSYAPLFASLESAGIERKNITAMWTFTTVSK